MKRKTILQCAVASVTIGLIGVGVVLAVDQVWVGADWVAVFQGPDNCTGKVGTAVKGTKLTLLQKEDDFYKVHYKDRIQDVEGYVAAIDISSMEVVGNAGSGQASVDGNTTAAKGFKPEEYASSRHISTSYLKSLEARLAKPLVEVQDMKDFMAEGKVGPAKYRTGPTTAPTSQG